MEHSDEKLAKMVKAHFVLCDYNSVTTSFTFLLCNGSLVLFRNSHIKHLLPLRTIRNFNNLELLLFKALLLKAQTERQYLN